MLMVISPAKTLDYSCRNFPDYTVPSQLDQSQCLVNQLRKMDPDELGKLMKISSKLAELNYSRYQDFAMPFDLENAKQALLVFKGDVYKGIDVEHYDAADLAFAQDHLRILSGLYGVLRPLDLIQPYRLEMGTKLKTSQSKNLYEFWGSQLARLINQALDQSSAPYLVNLASNEYFKAIDQNALQAKVLNLTFKENKNGVFKVIGIHAKRARGLMVDYAIKNRIENPEGLKNFGTEGYQYDAKLSSEQNWVFCRS